MKTLLLGKVHGLLLKLAFSDSDQVCLSPSNVLGFSLVGMYTVFASWLSSAIGKWELVVHTVIV